MIFGTPVSWFLVELFSFIVFFIVVSHAVKQENSFLRILELFGFMLGAAIFENVGTNVVHTYYYDFRRIIMVGGVPLEILLLEASIWYAAFNLAKKLNLPVWAIPFVVGLFGSVQDMTIDPAAVFDRVALPQTVADSINLTHPGALGNGIMSGQWNWTDPGYEGGFFGIPFYNYSGWMYLMFYYTVYAMVGDWLYRKLPSSLSWIGNLYPFIAGIIQAFSFGNPLGRFLLFGKIDPSQSTLTSELLILCLNFAFAIALLIAFRKKMKPMDLKQDGLILFAIPVILHIYDIVYAFARGTTVAYVPVLVVSAIHFAYLFLLIRQNRKLMPVD